MPLFQRSKYDVIIVAARFSRPGEVDWVRAYVRRGPTWSDRNIISRADLIERIQAGERVVTGKRKVFEASTFDVGETVNVEARGGKPFLVVGSANGDADILQGVPIL